VRVIAATNRDLKADIGKRRFREDLYFRLNVFPIEALPLRERVGDIPLLVRHFITLTCRRLNRPEPRLTQANLQQLQNYPWPGNIRELQNVLERALIVSQGNRLGFGLPDRSPEHEHKPDETTPTEELKRPFPESERRDRDRSNIQAALRLSDGKISGAGGAAELLDIPATTLASRMKALKIEKP